MKRRNLSVVRDGNELVVRVPEAGGTWVHLEIPIADGTLCLRLTEVTARTLGERLREAAGMVRPV